VANTENAQRPMVKKKRNKGLGVRRQGSHEIRSRRMYDKNYRKQRQDRPKDARPLVSQRLRRTKTRGYFRVFDGSNSGLTFN